MTQLIVQLDNEEKAKLLSEMLSALTFVNSVEVTKEKAHTVLETSENTEEFFSQAGLWKNRDISVESIRSKAWPERSK